MAFMRLGFVLALFCGITSASWGPSDLQAAVGVTKGDLVDLTVQWQAAGCPIAYYTLYTKTPNEDREQETSTGETSFTVQNKEFWTNYTVTLETSLCWVSKSLVAYVNTGPGNPHPVSGAETAASAVDANITIQEALMPRLVDQYNVTWCTAQAECGNQIFARNKHGGPATFDLKLNELTPKTEYSLSVVPEISFEGKVYRGREYSTKFVTKDVDVPVPTDVRAAFSWDEVDLQEVDITWKMAETAYELTQYNVTITSEDDPSFLETRMVKTAEVLFKRMPNSARLMANVTPIFNVSQHLLHRDSAVYEFNTPQAVPEPVNFTSVGLNTTSIFAAWNTSVVTLSNAVTFNFEYTDPNNNTQSKNVTATSILVSDLLPNTTYKVAISVLPDPEYFLNGTFTTLAKDYAAPANIEADLSGESANTASYDVTWTSEADPEKASNFKVESCNRDTKLCVSNDTTATQLVLPFDYFAEYDLTVTAVYALRLNQTQERSSQIGVRTPGTEPSTVGNIALKSVTASDAVLTWNAPGNVPVNVTKVYKVFDEANKLINETQSEQIQISNLPAYSPYNVSIQATAIYDKAEYAGNQTSYQFTTDAAAPGAPGNVTVEQNVRSNVIQVFWTAPTEANGPLDYYEVVTEDAAGDVISNLTNLVATKSVTVELPSANGDANYTVSVRAVNVNLNDEALPGDVTLSVLAFKGIEPPTAEVVKRSSSSLTLKVTPSAGTGDLTGLFYVLTNGNNSFEGPSDQVEVTNLTAYTNETIEVRACYLPTFCSEAFTISELTNVAAPSAVQGLKGNFSDRTIPYINWTAPAILNGPLDGYLLNLKDLTNSSFDMNEVLPSNQTSYVHDTTKEFEKYNFTVTAFNYDLDLNDTRVIGDLSSTIVKTTGKSAPKPENVREVNKTSTSASFQWERPEYPDFNVTYYLIQVESLDFEEFTNETEVTLNNLKPWTKTTILTSGCTTDNATSCGQPGSYFIETAVDKPSEPLSIIASNVTKTEASVSWKAPATPNGPIDGYRVAVSVSGDQNLTWNDVKTEVAAYKLTKLSDGTKYTVHVLAYNIDGDTSAELDSPTSTATFTTTSVAGASFPWWIIVVALLFVIAAASSLGVVVYRRRKAREDAELLLQDPVN